MRHVHSQPNIEKNILPNTEIPQSPTREQTTDNKNSAPNIIPKLSLSSLLTKDDPSKSPKAQTDVSPSQIEQSDDIKIGEPQLVSRTPLISSSGRLSPGSPLRKTPSKSSKNRFVTIPQSEAGESSNSPAKSLSPRKLGSSVSNSSKELNLPKADLKRFFEEVEWTELDPMDYDSTTQHPQPPLVKSPISELSKKRKSEVDMGAERKKIRSSQSTLAMSTSSSDAMQSRLPTSPIKNDQAPNSSRKTSFSLPLNDLAKHAIKSRLDGKPWIGKASGNSVAGRLQGTLESLYKANSKKIDPDVYKRLQQLFGLLPAGSNDEDTTFTLALKQSITNLGLNDAEWQEIETLHQNFDKLDLSTGSDTYAEFKAQLGKIIETKNELLSKKQ